MKKLKKMGSWILAMAMLMSLFAVSASALTQTTDNPITELTVTKTVVSSAGVSLPSADFKISMVPADDLRNDMGVLLDTSVDSKGTPVEEGLALATDTLTFHVDTQSDNADGEIVMKQKFALTSLATGVAYTHTGVYRYYITEELPTDEEGDPITSNGYITYDDTKYTVDLYVEQDDDKNFVITSVILHSDKTATADEKPSAVTFTNTVACQNVEIYKKVEGVEYQKDQLFKFYVMIPINGSTITLEADEDGETYVKAYIKKGSNTVIDTGTDNADNIARTEEDGLVKLYIAGDTIESAASEGTAVYLKSGEHLEIAGAPVSMVYKVAEEDYSSQNYVTTLTYKETGTFESDTITGETASNVEGREVVGTVNTGTNEVRFTNSREIVVPGGISMDIIPYVVIVLVAVAGGVLLVSKKRRASR